MTLQAMVEVMMEVEMLEVRSLKMRHSREVLQENSGRGEGHLSLVLLLLPVQDVLDVGLFSVEAVAVAHGRLQEDADGQRQLVCKQQTQS